MKAPIDWLLAGEPFIEYRTRVDLLGRGPDDPLVRSARQNMLKARAGGLAFAAPEHEE